MNRATAVTLARVSCLTAPIGLIMNLIVRGAVGAGLDSPGPQPELEGELLACGLLLCLGLFFAVLSLNAARRLGPKKIRLPAALGMVLNCLLLLILIGSAVLDEG